MNNKFHIVLDRDGTIIEHVHYLKDPDKIVLMKNVKNVLENWIDEGHNIYIHTNQSGIERGYYSLSDVNKCNDKMLSLLGKKIRFSSICIAPNITNTIKKNYRKPSTLFGNEILQSKKIKSSNMIYIGDSYCAILTAVNLNCYGIQIGKKKLKKIKIDNRQIFRADDWIKIKEIVNELSI